MDSRFKENPERTFDLVLKVKCQASENEDPVVLWKFPEDFGDQLNIHIVFEGEKEFHRNVKLWGVIDVKRSYVNMTATKIEVTMRKAEPLLWASLELPVSNTEQKKENSDQ